MSWIREQFIINGYSKATNTAIAAAAEHAQNANEWAEYARDLEDYSEELKVEIKNLKSEVTAYKEQKSDDAEEIEYLRDACYKKNLSIKEKDAEILRLKKMILKYVEEHGLTPSEPSGSMKP